MMRASARHWRFGRRVSPRGDVKRRIRRTKTALKALKTLDLAKERGFAPNDFNGLPRRRRSRSVRGRSQQASERIPVVVGLQELPHPRLRALMEHMARRALVDDAALVDDRDAA